MNDRLQLGNSVSCALAGALKSAALGGPGPGWRPLRSEHLAALVESARDLAAGFGLNWYAIYTSANHERKVAQQLSIRGVEHFLPEYESVRNWKDRRVHLQLPLFPGYLFVYIAPQNRVAVLQVPGVARLVGFNGEPTAIPAEDVLRVREFLSHGLAAEPHPFLRVGRRVRVICGPLAGMEGIVVRRKNRMRLVISFELIQRSMSVEVAATDVAAA